MKTGHPVRWVGGIPAKDLGWWGIVGKWGRCKLWPVSDRNRHIGTEVPKCTISSFAALQFHEKRRNFSFTKIFVLSDTDAVWWCTNSAQKAYMPAHSELWRQMQICVNWGADEALSFRKFNTVHINTTGRKSANHMHPKRNFWAGLGMRLGLWLQNWKLRPCQQYKTVLWSDVWRSVWRWKKTIVKVRCKKQQGAQDNTKADCYLKLKSNIELKKI